MIDKMGDKASAIATMKAAGVPTIPGSEGLIESFDKAKKIAKKKHAGILFHAQIILVVGNHEGAKRMKRLVHGLVRPHPGLDDVAERAPPPKT